MKTRWLRGVWTLVALGSCALPAGAVEKRIDATSGSSGSKQAQAGTTACPADDRVGGAGLRAFIDPQTGQLRQPTPEELAALALEAREEFARAVDSLEAVVHPDGTVSVDLKGLFMQSVIAVQNPDGSVSIRCVPNLETAVPLAAPASPKPAPVLEEK